jgi:hypothetical protein
MLKWGFYNQFTHVMIVVVVCEQNTIIYALLVIWSEVQWGANCYLQSTSKTSEHQVTYSLNCKVKLLFGLPVVAHHDGQVWMKAIFGHPGKTSFNVFHLIALV